MRRRATAAPRADLRAVVAQSLREGWRDLETRLDLRPGSLDDGRADALDRGEAVDVASYEIPHGRVKPRAPMWLELGVDGHLRATSWGAAAAEPGGVTLDA